MKLTWIGPFDGTGAYPTINRQLTAALERAGHTVLRNVHNDGGDLTPVCVTHTYPLREPTLLHELNVGLAVWEFCGAQGVPLSFQAAFKTYDLIGAPSAWVCEQFQAVTDTPVRRIQWGVDPAEYNPVGPVWWLSCAPDLDEAEKIILWVGGTDRRHGFDVAVQVMDRLPETWHLIAKQSVHYPEQASPHPRVHVIRQDLADMAPLYRSADVFLHSARGVGFSLPCLEALACGLPVASTDLPPVHEYAGDRVVFSAGTWQLMGLHHVHSDCSPVWFEPDVEALAVAVQQAAQLPKQTSPNGELETAWSWDAAAARLEQVISAAGTADTPAPGSAAGHIPGENQMTAYPPSDEFARGSWKPFTKATGVPSAAFTCPRCGTTGMLFDHQIAPDGTVTPSVVCPNEECSFHEMIRLEGWQS